MGKAIPDRLGENYKLFHNGEHYLLLRPDGSAMATCTDSKAAFELLELIDRGHKWTWLRQQLQELDGAVKKFQKEARR